MRAISIAMFLVVAVACESEPPLKLGITPQQHTPFFPITGKVPHALGVVSQNGTPIDCDACHAAAADFAVPLCQQCHAQDAVSLDRAHTGITGYVAQDDACYACHKDGTRGPELDVDTHSLTIFPILASDIHGNSAFRARAKISDKTESCLSCHTSNDDRSTTSCLACHRADPEPLLAGHASLPLAFVPDDDHCKACHADIPIPSVVHPLANHAFFDPNHHQAVCNNCHTANRIDPQPWAIDFSKNDCTGCHTHGSNCTPSNQGVCVQ
jgi:hypothetical protein